MFSSLFRQHLPVADIGTGPVLTLSGRFSCGPRFSKQNLLEDFSPPQYQHAPSTMLLDLHSSPMEELSNEVDAKGYCFRCYRFRVCGSRFRWWFKIDRPFNRAGPRLQPDGQRCPWNRVIWNPWQWDGIRIIGVGNRKSERGHIQFDRSYKFRR